MGFPASRELKSLEKIWPTSFDWPSTRNGGKRSDYRLSRFTVIADSPIETNAIAKGLQPSFDHVLEELNVHLSVTYIEGRRRVHESREFIGVGRS